MIDMGHKIARLQLSQRTQRKGLILTVGLLYFILMIALKDLVIGISNQL